MQHCAEGFNFGIKGLRINQTSRESAVLSLKVCTLNTKQVCVLNPLQETSQLQSSVTVTLKATSSIKTNL
jgi:hypothetical protein